MRYFIIFPLFAIPSPHHASGDVTYNAAAPPRPIVISELMWSGSSGSTADEWIELYNRSAATIDLSGWTLTRLSNGEFQLMFIFDTASIASGQTFLIANCTVDLEKFRVATKPQFVSISISQPNSKFILQLYNNNPTNGG